MCNGVYVHVFTYNSVCVFYFLLFVRMRGIQSPRVYAVAPDLTEYAGVGVRAYVNISEVGFNKQQFLSARVNE